jgi:hypothetical protein
MSGEVWMIIIGAILLLCAVVAVSCAKVSGRCSDWERQMEAKREAEKDGKP